MTGGAVRVFSHERGNVYLREIGELAVAGFREAGIDAQLCTRGLPGYEDRSLDLVIAPHEYFLFERAIDPLGVVEAAQSVAVLNTEQPDTPWFDLALEYCSVSPLVFDLSSAGSDALHRAGIDAEEFRLGHTKDWDLLGGELRNARPTDVVFMGASTLWRERVIANLAEALAERKCRILFFDSSHPVSGAAAGFLSGPAKLELLASARVLLNIHREEGSRYFEWHRCLPALLNGAVLVSEPSTSHDPLVPFVDFVTLEPEWIEGYLIALLDDEPRRLAMAESAYERVRTARPFSETIARTIERMRDKLGTPAPTTRVVPGEAGRALVAAQLRARLGARTRRSGPLGPDHGPEPADRVAYGVKRILLEQRRLTASLDRLLRAASPDSSAVDQLFVTEWFDASTPEVSVVVPLFNHADFVAGAIESVLTSRGVAVEVIVVDDGSTDESASVVAELMRARPSARIKLVRHAENRGLAAARNTGFVHAACDAVFLLDADNEVFGDGIARLYRELSDPEVGFAYGILTCFGDEERLASHYPWDVTRLCKGNYVDAMALVRKSLWQQVGGYSSGPSDVVFGWEDYQFWLGCAAEGARPAFVPELVGRYRIRFGSMISITNIDSRSAEEYLRRSFPALPWPRRGALHEEVVV